MPKNSNWNLFVMEKLTEKNTVFLIMSCAADVCMLSEIVSVVGSCLTPLKHFPQQLRPETFDKNKFPSQPPSPGPQGYIRDHLTWNIDTVQRFVYFSYCRTVFSCVINITISVDIIYLSLEQTLHRL